MRTRTVQLLDRKPGQPADDMTREVAGFTIEKGIPLPAPKVSGICLALMALEVGESILHSNSPKKSIIAARRPGKKFTVRKMPDGNYRIWRTE